MTGLAELETGVVVGAGKLPTWISVLGIPPASGEVVDLPRGLNCVVHQRLVTPCKEAQLSS